MGLLPETEPGNERSVTGGIFLFQITKQPAAPADQKQQAAPTCEILTVPLQMRVDFGNPLCKQSNLHLRAAGIFLAPTVFHD